VDGAAQEQRLWSQVAEREFTRLRGRRLREFIAERDRFSAFVKQLVEQGIAEGTFDPTLNPSIVTSCVFELMNTSGNWFRPSGELSYAELAEWFATFVVSGLGLPEEDR